MSIKSIIINPDKSLILICLAISSAASIFVSKAVLSTFFCFMDLPELTSIDTEIAGLGGDVNYFKLDLRTAQFIPTVDLWNQSLSIIARLGIITPLDDDEVAPFYDRFYLGGPETLRGYDYRDIGPLSTDGVGNYSEETSGGHTYGLFSAEYLFQN